MPFGPKTDLLEILRLVLQPQPCYDLLGLRLPGLVSLRQCGSRQLATTSVVTSDGQCEQIPGTYSARFVQTRLRGVPRS